jgi:predicted HTH domain antitoxin
MASLILKFPDHFGIDEGEAKMTLAAGLYKKGKLSLGQAAELVGLSKGAFMELLALYDADIIHYSPEELDNDLANAKDYSR